MNKDINFAVGARVRAARVEARLGIVDVVSKLRNPISIQQFAKYETGKNRWPVDLLCDAARILNLDITKLCEDQTSEQKDVHP